jgi:hypothetical protein
MDSPLDSIVFAELAPIVTDTTSLKTNVSYQDVTLAFNYPLVYYIVGGIVFVLLILVLLFGKRMLRYLKLRRLKKEYEKFSSRLTEYIRELKKQPDPQLAEEALVYWKKYQQKLDDQPFESYTTRDILRLSFAQELEKPLKSIDRLIYGNRNGETVYQDFQQIEDFSQHRFTKKVAEIQDGK